MNILHRKKILFVIPSLGGGGAERITVYLIKYLESLGTFDIHLLLLRNAESTYMEMLPNDITITNLNLKRRIRYSSFKIMKAIVKIRPDICFINMNGVNLQLSMLLPFIRHYNIKFIARETNVISAGIIRFKFLYKILYKIFYNNYDHVIVQSDDMGNDLINNFGIKADLITKINNPIPSKWIESESLKDNSFIFSKGIKNFLCIGRLVHQKGYDILLNSLSILPKDTLKLFHIYILGKGPLEIELTQLIDKYNLGDVVSLLGHVSNPYPIIRESDGIVLSSRYEGFPNVLLEANILGKPIFSNNCPGGINEIIIENKNGIICDMSDHKIFTQKFSKFLSTDYSASQVSNITYKRYDSSVILPQYYNIFKQILESSKK